MPHLNLASGDELAFRQISYDLPPAAAPPAADTFLVSLGKRGIGSVYHIVSVRARRVQQPTCCRYFLQVLPAPDMVPYTQFHGEGQQPCVTVKGAPAAPLYWYPRTKKKAK